MAEFKGDVLLLFMIIKASMIKKVYSFSLIAEQKIIFFP